MEVYGGYLSGVTRHSYELRIPYVPIQLTRNNGFLQKPKAMILVCHRAYMTDKEKEEMNNNSLIRYCRFHYPPSNANSQAAESELHKLDKTLWNNHSKSDNEVFGRCSRLPLYELCSRSSHVLSENDSSSPSGIPDGLSADSQTRFLLLDFFQFKKQHEHKARNDSRSSLQISKYTFLKTWHVWTILSIYNDLIIRMVGGLTRFQEHRE